MDSSDRRSSDARVKAERQLASKAKAAVAVSDWQKAEQAVADKTARLRALRLAKEESDRLTLASQPPAAKKKKAAPRPRKSEAK
jgi:hypothetical protein